MIHEAQEVLEFNTFVREKLATFYARSQSSIPHNSLLFKRRTGKEKITKCTRYTLWYKSEHHKIPVNYSIYYIQINEFDSL